MIINDKNKAKFLNGTKIVTVVFCVIEINKQIDFYMVFGNDSHK